MKWFVYSFEMDDTGYW